MISLFLQFSYTRLAHLEGKSPPLQLGMQCQEGGCYPISQKRVASKGSKEHMLNLFPTAP